MIRSYFEKSFFTYKVIEGDETLDITRAQESSFKKEAMHQIGVVHPLAPVWLNTLEHYEDPTQHEEFLKSCWRLGKMDFAIDKYEGLLSTLPEDQMALEMKKRSEAYKHIPFSEPVVQNSKKLFQWGVRSFVTLYLLFCVTLILLGSFEESLRNLIGLGTALLVLFFGFIIYMIRR